MKTRRYSEGQVFRILQEVDAGSQVVDVARKHGVSPATIHRWKSKYSGMTLSELKRLKYVVTYRLHNLTECYPNSLTSLPPLKLQLQSECTRVHICI